jgi:PHS family inorganic phosphate transporter-like MFS transporter
VSDQVQVAAPGAGSVGRVLDEAPLSRFHRRAVVVSGVGFFTDAYDLFVISTVSTLVAAQWHLSTLQASWVSGSAILAAFFGAVVFGRLADLLGRRRVYAVVAAIMIVGAVASSVAPDFLFLVVARFVLGLGIGGDYPVSAVLMSEYANRRDRGRLVGLVFSMQAVGLVVGPLVGLALLGAGVGHELAWRLLLGLGALPAAAVVYLRSTMPESPRFRASVGDEAGAVADLAPIVAVDEPVAAAEPPAPAAPVRPPARLGDFLADRRMLLLVLGTAGSWFLFDYAYYGNTLSLPVILKDVDSHATLVAKLAWSLAIFVVFAVPGYLLAVLRMDRIGHRRLQLLGFAVMAATFLALGLAPVLTTLVGPFLAVFGLSYFFVEFGPNTTTFVLPSEVFPVRFRTTGHGVAAGIGKLGAFVGVFLVPQLEKAIDLRGMLVVAAAASAAGLLLTLVLPEPARRSLDEADAGYGPPVLRLVPGATAGSDRRSEPAVPPPSDGGQMNSTSSTQTTLQATAEVASSQRSR